MITLLSGLKSHFARWREWEANPIVIKELRQGVRSWSVTGMLLLFLLVLFFASLGFLIGESLEINGDHAIGGQMFSTFATILGFSSILFIPHYTGVRIAAERAENNMDLLYVSTLSPARIILGKFLSSAYLAVLFFSACMPFMAFTNLLRGVDLPTVFLSLAFLFLLVCVVNMVAIFLACLPLSRAFKFLFIIAGLILPFVMVAWGTAVSFFVMRSGVGAMMAERDFWIRVLTVALLGVALLGFFFVLSVALISPPSANRALPVRIYIFGLWLLVGALNFFWIERTRDSARIMASGVSSFLLMVLALVNVISNSDQLSLRVRRQIPAPAIKRWIAFLFFNGAAGGLVWAAVIFSAICVGTWAALAWVPSPAVSANVPQIFRILTVYAFAYALTALYLHRRFMPKRAPKLAGLLAVLLVGGWAVAPGIFLFFANRLSWRSLEGLQLGNIFNVLSVSSHEGTELFYHEIFAFGWLLIIAGLNLKWFCQQVRNFRPPVAPPPIIGR